MPNQSKRRGTRFETAVCRYMRDRLDDGRIERRAMHGSRDMGDLYGLYAHGYEGVVECKSHHRWSPSDRAAWEAQTLAERGNADAGFAALVIDVPNRPVWRSLVRMTVRDLLRSGYGIELDCRDELDETWAQMELGDWCALMGGDPA